MFHSQGTKALSAPITLLLLSRPALFKSPFLSAEFSSSPDAGSGSFGTLLPLLFPLLPDKLGQEFGERKSLMLCKLNRIVELIANFEANCASGINPEIHFAAR